jgi:hypothetical protein
VRLSSSSVLRRLCHLFLLIVLCSVSIEDFADYVSVTPGGVTAPSVAGSNMLAWADTRSDEELPASVPSTTDADAVAGRRTGDNKWELGVRARKPVAPTVRVNFAWLLR